MDKNKSPQDQGNQNNTQSDKQDNLSEYLQDFKTAWAYKNDNYHSTWDDCWRVYNLRRVKVGYNAIADRRVPETRTIVESLVANIAGGSPKFAYIPTNDEQEKDTDVLTELMDYYWDCNHMGTKAQSWVRDSILYGTGILHVTWDSKRNIPCIDNVPLRDFFIDPTATSLENARYVGFRYLADIETLKGMKAIDPVTGKEISKYKNLDKLATDLSDPAKDELDKQKKEQLIGSTLGTDNERQCEVVLIYYGDTNRVVEIANRIQVIRDVETPYQMPEHTQKIEASVDGGVPTKVDKKIDAIEPFYPFAILRNIVDPSLFFGTGDVEIIMDSQEALNDVENLDMDNLHYLNNVMWRIDPAYEDMAAEIESSPGIVIPVPRGALEPLEKPPITNDLDVKKQDIKEEMRRATAADEIMQGALMTRGRATATEISAVTNQALARFKTKVTNLESEGFAQLGSVLFKVSQIFVDQKMVVRIVGPDGVNFKDFDPYEYSGYYEPHVRLETTIKDKQIEQGQKLNQMYQILLNPAVLGGTVNPRETVRFVMKTLGADDDDIERILDVAPMSPLQNPMQAIQASQQQQQADPMASLLGGQAQNPENAPMNPAMNPASMPMPAGVPNGQ